MDVCNKEKRRKHLYLWELTHHTHGRENERKVKENMTYRAEHGMGCTSTRGLE
jgi:hypothetical protein